MMEAFSRRMAGGRRIEALEVEIRELRAAMADTTKRLGDLERRANVGARALQKATDALGGIKQRGKADELAFVELRTAMLRLDLELQRHADEVHTTAAGLLERIEAVRKRSPVSPA